jgi:hypothetical protein
MVEEPSHGKLLSVKHVCKMGLISVIYWHALFVITSMPCEIVFFGYRCGGGRGRIGTCPLPSILLTQQVLRIFFSNFGLIFQYVSPLDPWI